MLPDLLRTACSASSARWPNVGALRRPCVLPPITQILPLLSELRAGNLVGNVEALTQVGWEEGKAAERFYGCTCAWMCQPKHHGCPVLAQSMQTHLMLPISVSTPWLDWLRKLHCLTLQVAAEAAADIQRLQTEVRGCL